MFYVACILPNKERRSCGTKKENKGKISQVVKYAEIQMSPEAQTGQDIRGQIMMMTTTMMMMLKMMMLLMRSTCLQSSKLGEYLIPKLRLGQMMMKVVTTMTLIMMLSIINTSMSNESNDGMMTKAKSISAGWL